MDNIASHEDWKSRFSEIAPGLLLFARQWARSPADAEDIVQEAFVKFWRRNDKIDNRALLYATVRSIALDFSVVAQAALDAKPLSTSRVGPSWPCAPNETT
jgi:RNA polymerase sigma-70 factor (ECF subfamily)